MSIQAAATLLKNAHRAVVLTGAGVSTPSGIPDFRTPGSGMWDNADPHVVASMYNFRIKPQLFYNWIRPVAHTLLTAKPNPAHHAIATLEELGIVQAVVTQNIDMLHTRAGSQTVHEVHGTIASGTCLHCYTRYPVTDFVEEFIATGQIPRCPHDDAMIKPDVVLFGEALPRKPFQAAQRATKCADVMIVAGSSLEVAPVSNLPEMALVHGARLIVVNREETYIDRQAAVVLRADVAEALPAIVAHLEAS